MPNAGTSGAAMVAHMVSIATLSGMPAEVETAILRRPMMIWIVGLTPLSRIQSVAQSMMFWFCAAGAAPWPGASVVNFAMRLFTAPIAMFLTWSLYWLLMLVKWLCAKFFARVLYSSSLSWIAFLTLAT